MFGLARSAAGPFLDMYRASASMGKKLRGYMGSMNEVRPGEVVVDAPTPQDAAVAYIGRIRTPWKSPRECPRRGDYENGPLCRIELASPWEQALAGIEQHTHLQILYWMHLARRDLAVQSPRHANRTMGTFALRSPNRPNPIAASLVALVGVEGNVLHVRGLDCVDGTPLIDIKPENCPHATPRAPDAEAERT